VLSEVASAGIPYISSHQLKAWNHARRTLDVKRVSPEWYQNGLGWLEYVSGRTCEEELRATLVIALANRIDNRFKCPVYVGETRSSARNHPLNVVSLRLLNEEYHSTWIPKE